jgi:hypothetical protein
MEMTWALDMEEATIHRSPKNPILLRSPRMMVMKSWVEKVLLSLKLWVEHTTYQLPVSLLQRSHLSLTMLQSLNNLQLQLLNNLPRSRHKNSNVKVLSFFESTPNLYPLPPLVLPQSPSLASGNAPSDEGIPIVE